LRPSRRGRFASISLEDAAVGGFFDQPFVFFHRENVFDIGRLLSA